MGVVAAEQIGHRVGIGLGVIANLPSSNQPVYNALNRGVEEQVLPTCHRNGLGMVVFSPLAQGVLTGKYLPGQPAPAGSRGADEKSNMFMASMMEDAVLERVQRLGALLAEHDTSVAAFALAWCLRQEAVSSVIIGATRPEQVEENVKASGLELPLGVWEEAEKILGDGTRN